MQDLDLISLGNRLTELVSSWGLRVVGAIVVLVVGFGVARIARRAAARTLRRSNIDDILVGFLSGAAYYLVLAFVLISVLGLFGIPTTSFVAVLGAAGLAIGLALQGTLSNFAAGAMLLFFRPFRIGDYVEAGGAEGSVVAVNVFTTVLETLDRVTLVVPNSAIWGSTIRNFTSTSARRNDIAIGIAYESDIGAAIDVIKKTLLADERVLRDPEPLVVVSGLGDSSVDLLVAPYCDPAHYWDLRFDMTRRLKEALDAAGITIPFPQRDVHLYETKSA